MAISKHELQSELEIASARDDVIRPSDTLPFWLEPDNAVKDVFGEPKFTQFGRLKDSARNCSLARSFNRNVLNRDASSRNAPGVLTVLMVRGVLP